MHATCKSKCLKIDNLVDTIKSRLRYRVSMVHVSEIRVVSYFKYARTYMYPAININQLLVLVPLLIHEGMLFCIHRIVMSVL